VRIYHVGVTGAESLRCMSRIDRQALPSAGREWRWTTISVAPEFSADESHGQTNPHSRIRPRLSWIQTQTRKSSRLAQSRGPNRGHVAMSLERHRLMVIPKSAARAAVIEGNRVTNNQRLQ